MEGKIILKKRVHIEGCKITQESEKNISEEQKDNKDTNEISKKETQNDENSTKKIETKEDDNQTDAV